MSDIEDTDQRYPEHAKLTKISGKSQTIGEFLDWLLNESEYQLGTVERDKLVPTYVSIEKLLGKYFGIDQKKLNLEKERMIQEVRVVNTLRDIEEL